MSEGKWKHPVFEQIKNAEIEAPDYIMHEAIRRSHKKSFMFFQWNTFNLWYVLIGLSAVMTFFVVSKGETKNELVEKKVSNVAIKIQESKVENKELNSSDVALEKETSKRNNKNSRLKENFVNAVADNNNQEKTPLLKPKQDSQMVLEDAIGANVDKVSSDSVSHSSPSVGGIDVNSPKVEEKIDLKKGRGLRVKLGGNSKP